MYNPGKSKYPLYFKGSDFPLAIVRIRRQEPFDLHKHDFTELVVINDGHGIHLTEAGEYEVGPGDVFVIPPGMLHGFRRPRSLGLANILFYLEHLAVNREYLAGLPGFVSLFAVEPRLRDRHQFRSRLYLAPEQLRTVNSWVQQLEEELESAAPGYELMAVSWLMRLIGYLSRAYAGNEGTASEEVRRIGLLTAYMERHYTRDLRLAELASAAHMSARTLQRVFRQATGASPVHYLVRLRIRQACDWLRTTDLPVADIGARVGLKDSNYFARLFHQEMGQSPSDYRRHPRPPPGVN